MTDLKLNHDIHINGIYSLIKNSTTPLSFSQIYAFAKSEYQIPYETVKATLTYLTILGSIVELKDEFGICWGKPN